MKNSSLAGFSRSMSTLAKKHTPWYTFAVMTMSVVVTLIANACWDMEQQTQEEKMIETMYRVRDLETEDLTGDIAWWGFKFDFTGRRNWPEKNIFKSHDEARMFLDNSYQNEGGDSIPNRLEIVEVSVIYEFD